VKRKVSSVALTTGVAVSYADVGEPTAPVVVLLPGPTDSWRSYEPVLEGLSKSSRAIAVSQRGHGDSDKPPSGYQVDDFAADVRLLLDALGIERAVLAGHSGSCLWARRVAIDHPDRVVGLVLEASPSTLRGHAGLEEFVESVVAGLSDPIGVDFARSVIADTSSRNVQPELMDELAGEVMKVPARVWTEMFRGLLAYDDLAELRAIAAPTLLVWGDADEIVGRRDADALAAAIERAELRVYEGVGHTPRWEEPMRFVADVAVFVQACHGLAR
jgi:pimeloyl-ACP methyl ester carboxylesterase